jgi:hypothetical protein
VFSFGWKTRLTAIARRRRDGCKTIGVLWSGSRVLQFWVAILSLRMADRLRGIVFHTYWIYEQISKIYKKIFFSSFYEYRKSYMFK